MAREAPRVLVHDYRHAPNPLLDSVVTTLADNATGLYLVTPLSTNEEDGTGDVLQRIQDAKPDVVVLCNAYGRYLTDSMRSSLPGTPVVAITSYPHDDAVTALKDVTPHAFRVPFADSVLLRTVDAALRSRHGKK